MQGSWVEWVGWDVNQLFVADDSVLLLDLNKKLQMASEFGRASERRKLKSNLKFRILKWKKKRQGKYIF